MSASDLVRVAVVGAGFISDYHVNGIRNAGNAEVAVLVGRNRERVAARAAELGVPRAGTDYSAVLADDEIDAVVIATPDATHRTLAEAALAAGKSVLLQKPMAMNSAECTAIIKAADASNGHLTVSFMHRYFPEVRWLRERIAAGSFGTIHTLRLRNATPGAGWADWFFDPAMVAGGVVMQLGVHGIDLLQHLVGPITTVSARVSTRKPVVRMDSGRDVPVPFEDNAVALYGFEAGHDATHEICWTEVAGCDRFRLEIYFEQATVWLRSHRGPAMIAGASGPNGAEWRTVDLEPVPFDQAHHSHWLDIVRGKVPPDDTPAAGLSTLNLAEHIYRAAREGVTLSVPGTAHDADQDRAGTEQ